MKKKILIITILLLVIGSIIFFVYPKEEKTKDNNIAIVIEQNDGTAVEVDEFPVIDYAFDRVECNNASNTVTPTFNTETNKLDVEVSGDKLQSLDCTIYFKYNATR